MKRLRKVKEWTELLREAFSKQFEQVRMTDLLRYRLSKQVASKKLVELLREALSTQLTTLDLLVFTKNEHTHWKLHHECVRFQLFLTGLQDFVQEVARTLVLRVFKYLFRSAAFNDMTFIHKDDTVSHFTSKAHLVGHNNHGHPFVSQVLHNA